VRFSKYLIPTLREVKEESISFNLSLKAGLISSLASGIYTYLPLGLKVLRKIENIIRKHMNLRGANEILMPALQPLELWSKTGRDKLLGEVMIKFEDRRGRKLCLGPTHEEVVTDLASKYISSYKQLPLILYQIQSKFRDEVRPKSGLIRGCEFVMKDAYSFDSTGEGLDHNYELILSAYKEIFKECGVDTAVLEADTGFIGGSKSHEFLAPADSGEDILLYCGKCGSYFKDGKQCPKCSNRPVEEKKALELGHIFKLGVKYSGKLGADFLDDKSRRLPLIMGCYGIGVSRIISAVIEQNYDKDGIKWPVNIAPFDAEVICLNTEDKDVFSFAEGIYSSLKEAGLDVLFDDRPGYSGVKFKDSYLIGIPFLIVVGKKQSKKGKVEIIRRKDNLRVITEGEGCGIRDKIDSLC